ncbi:protein of unknown function DUF904 [Sulfolobus islandicus L.S.2.15]|uniref:Uncharacterized protein n=1 Tax=Saccharolobus islandicus (strain L.S.2.15 / Lassen \|nr:cell division protein ZapB [Sulfolobus islandicus]ACP36032.1 protein of unknown function DUF904 [Sulfolobus islandicus L.S.2.15]
MTVNEIIEENRELEQRYARALNTIAALEHKIAKLQKENKELLEENKKLQKYNNILMRAIEIAIQIKDYNAQTRHLKAVLQKLRETGEFKGD